MQGAGKLNDSAKSAIPWLLYITKPNKLVQSVNWG